MRFPGLLHCQHVTRLLDAIRDAALMFCRKASYLARKDFTCFGDETGKLFDLVEGVVHRVERTVWCFILRRHEGRKLGFARLSASIFFTEGSVAVSRVS